MVARDKIGSGGVSGGRDYTGTFWKVKDTFVTLIVVVVSRVCTCLHLSTCILSICAAYSVLIVL